VLVLLAVPLAILVSWPGALLPAALGRLSLPLGWVAWALGLAAALWYAISHVPRRVGDVAGLGGLVLGVPAACLANRWEVGSWVSYHVLLAVWAVLAVAGLVVALAARGRGWLRHWAEGLGLALVLLALRGGWHDPLRPYATAGPLLLA